MAYPAVAVDAGRVVVMFTPRLTCQAAVVGDELWLVGGWDPSAPAAPSPPPGSSSPFLNDVWALDLRSYRFAAALLPGGRLLLHTHRCDEHVLLLEAAAAAAAGESAAGEAAEGSAGTAQAGGGAGEAAGGRRRATLARVPVRGIFPGDQSPPSRGLHSVTVAAAPPPLPPLEEAAATAGAGASAGAALAAEPSTAIYLYGGAPQSGPMYGDLWVLNPNALTWRQLAPEGPAPQARCSHVAGACGEGGRFLLAIGGSFYAEPGKLQPLDDVVLYDTQTYNDSYIVTMKTPKTVVP
ncbi:hypothetical protein GPECTOR_52g18 [Gonium pectorale]|uniref:Uncharacterized protein n=1 Tax=Gonium pectorale TaxID=33097 RepID=A0A150G7T9_GONPE|nr:hypothetical protein GPECTOR_52g18 [Gonium pectorale]|eukprot:KXZ45615.1 hypothetical protein GPECTOR_52g18 [Gonium pectorale]